AVGDGVDDMRATLQDFVNLFALDALSVEVALGATGGDDAKAHGGKLADRRHDLVLVRVLYRHEHRAGERQLASAAELALGKGDSVVAVDAHDLAGRAHLRPEHGIDAGEAGEGEHRLLHRDIFEAWALEPEGGERLPRHHLGGDAGD